MAHNGNGTIIRFMWRTYGEYTYWWFIVINVGLFQCHVYHPAVITMFIGGIN
jgi:hypothetical protein